MRVLLTKRASYVTGSLIDEPRDFGDATEIDAATGRSCPKSSLVNYRDREASAKGMPLRPAATGCIALYSFTGNRLC